MKRVSKILSIALSAVLLLGALSGVAEAKAYDELTPWFFNELDEGNTYTIQNVEKLLVVNDHIWDENREGSFTIQTAGSAPQAAQYAQDELPVSGLQWSEIQPDLPEMIGRNDAAAAEGGDALYSQSGAACAVNDTLTLKGAINGGKRERDLDMVCLYVGKYCTVWGTTSDVKAIQLGGEQAAKIGTYFDEKYPTMKATFGDDFEDADGDGKVAIMCYDIGEDYKEGESFSGTYTGGFFDMKDMIRRDEDNDPVIGSVIFGESTAYPDNGMDCIRIDTYPVMGDTPDTLMANVENCYSTLFHEFQHMLNFSSGLHNFEADKTDDLYYMDTFLNEAFSMAAEHLVCGSNSTASRIDRFNGSDYKPGSPLTTWTGSLDNYANSYLFGQYLRTRYKQSGLADEADGSDFYRTVYDWCTDPTNLNGEPVYDEEGNQIRYNGNAMDVAAGLLQTNVFSLTVDFWTAVCLNQSSDVFGFAGEDWANAIQMKTSGISFDTSNGGIANSGAKLYELDADRTYTITAAKNCTLVLMSRMKQEACGENITWELAPNGVLYIEGDGSAITSTPWRDLPAGTQVTSVSLPAGLTSVPENAFAGLDMLDYVAFAGTVAGWQAIDFGSGNDAVTRAAATFDKNGQFVDYRFIDIGSLDEPSYYGEYSRDVDFSFGGADYFRVMAFNQNGPIDSARTFSRP